MISSGGTEFNAWAVFMNYAVLKLMHISWLFEVNMHDINP